MEFILADSAWDHDPIPVYFIQLWPLCNNSVGKETTVKHAFLRKKLSIWIIASNNIGLSVMLWVMWNTGFKVCLYLNALLVDLESLLPDVFFFTNLRSLSILTTRLQHSFKGQFPDPCRFAICSLFCSSCLVPIWTEQTSASPFIAVLNVFRTRKE